MISEGNKEEHFFRTKLWLSAFLMYTVIFTVVIPGWFKPVYIPTKRPWDEFFGKEIISL